MTRRGILTVVAVGLVAVASGFAIHAKSASAVTPGVIAVAGDVRVDENVVRAPVVAYPTPDYSIGIPMTTAGAPEKRSAGAPGAGASRQPVVSGFLTAIPVAQGDHVARGQVVALLDTSMLDLGVRQAEAARTRARANLDVLDHAIDKLASTRATLVTTRAQLVKTRASLATTIGVLARTRASLEASIALIQQIIAEPGGPPPHSPPYPVLLQGLQRGLAQLDAGLAGARAGLTKLDRGLTKLSLGLAQLDGARKQLNGARKLAAINEDAQGTSVSLARAKRIAATIVAPIDGVVTYTRSPGTAVMVGTPLVRIRPDGPTHVQTYLAADQLAQIRIGSAATVTFDSNPGAPLIGRVSHIDARAALPPTSFPTSIVHMTRAVRVTIELDDGQTAPPGTPVDTEISIGR